MANDEQENSMMDLFPEFFHLGDQEKRELYDSAHVVLDASAVLELFESSPNLVDEWFSKVESLKDESRLFLPHEAAKEILLRADALVLDAAHQHGRLASGLSSIAKTIEKEDIQPHANKELVEKYLLASTKLSDSLKRTATVMRSNVRRDPLKLRIAGVFEGCIGPAFSKEVLEKHEEESTARKKLKKPPGFEDSGHGDFLIWQQVLLYSKDTGCDVVFVTRDAKGDWWERPKREGKDSGADRREEIPIGPHRLLLQEFSRITGQRIHFLSDTDFLRVFGANNEAVQESKQRNLSVIALKLGKNSNFEPGASRGRMGRWWARLLPEHRSEVQIWAHDSRFWQSWSSIPEKTKHMLVATISEDYSLEITVAIADAIDEGVFRNPEQLQRWLFEIDRKLTTQE